MYDSFKNQFNSKFDELVINGNDIIQSSVVVKKNLIKKLVIFLRKKNLVTWEDFDLWLKISKITNKFNYIEKCLGRYFISENKKEKHKRFFKKYKIFQKKI